MHVMWLKTDQITGYTIGGILLSKWIFKEKVFLVDFCFVLQIGLCNTHIYHDNGLMSLLVTKYKKENQTEDSGKSKDRVRELTNQMQTYNEMNVLC